MVGQQGQCDADYQTAAFWKDAEYEYGGAVLLAEVSEPQ